MISDEHLKEFGFEDISKFPQVLTDHVVTISLPSAMAHRLDPVNVVIKKGLAIPVQVSGVPNGMIVCNDGKMVFVSHETPADFNSPLKVSFTDNIAFDIRIDAFNIMRRAVEVNEALGGVWLEILSHWIKWYPLLMVEVKRQKVGIFGNAKEAYKGFEQFLESFVKQSNDSKSIGQLVPFKIIVQTEEEDGKGWQGEEFLILESSTTDVLSKGLPVFMKDHVGPRLRSVLQNPVFYSQSTYCFYYEPRVIPVLKMVLIPPLTQNLDGLSRGIDL